VSGQLITVIVMIGVVGSICQWLAWRLRVPGMLFLLLAAPAPASPLHPP